MRLRDKVKDVKIKSYNSNINILERMNQNVLKWLGGVERMRNEQLIKDAWGRSG